MSIMICQSCNKRVDTDFEPFDDDEICENCLDDAEEYGEDAFKVIGK